MYKACLKVKYIKIKLLIGDCGFYIIEIEGMYFDVIRRNLLKKLYYERNIILAQSNVLWSTKSSSTVLNEISFKRGLLIFSNAGHNKRK
jgi:hypothetical protein